MGGNQTNQKNPSLNGVGLPREQEVPPSQEAEERAMGRMSREDYAAEPARKMRLPRGLKASQGGTPGCRWCSSIQKMFGSAFLPVFRYQRTLSRTGWLGVTRDKGLPGH